MNKKKWPLEVKLQIALDAIKGEKTLNQITTEHGVHSTQIVRWKKQALDGIRAGLGGEVAKHPEESEREIAGLHQKIGQLTIELDWLKKKCGGLT